MRKDKCSISTRGFHSPRPIDLRIILFIVPRRGWGGGEGEGEANALLCSQSWTEYIIAEDKLVG
jgi:hypothetical protein